MLIQLIVGSLVTSLTIEVEAAFIGGAIRQVNRAALRLQMETIETFLPPGRRRNETRPTYLPHHS